MKTRKKDFIERKECEDRKENHSQKLRDFNTEVIENAVSGQRFSEPIGVVVE
jgi:hypothetical protein